MLHFSILLKKKDTDMICERTKRNTLQIQYVNKNDMLRRKLLLIIVFCYHQIKEI